MSSPREPRTETDSFGPIDVPGDARTHLQDAAPVTFGQEFGAYDAQLALAEAAICRALPDVHALAIGGTAVRPMGSGTRAGLGEPRLPANEPGSSMMPGKVNPTQVEAPTMVCAQVMGHDVAIGIAAGQGQFELNVCKPLIAFDLLDSLRLLADAMASFRAHCIGAADFDAWMDLRVRLSDG